MEVFRRDATVCAFCDKFSKLIESDCVWIAFDMDIPATPFSRVGSGCGEH